MRVTGIGGGHGLSVTLEAARRYADEVSAVVTVADDGGSSGRLTRELGIPPPGDIRNCLVALADDEEAAQLFQHRFASGALAGHTVGNLIIAALAERTGDFTRAVREAGRLVRAHGSVYPSTTELVQLKARAGGGIVEGQVAVAETDARIQVVYLEPPCPAAEPEAVQAILAADQVVLGPGSLFTSLLATLLVPGIAKALNETRAHRVFVCNTRMQDRETSGLDAAAHIEAVLGHVGPDPVDAVVVQTPVLAGGGVAVERRTLEFLGVDIIEADVATAGGSHDPSRLAAVLAELR